MTFISSKPTTLTSRSKVSINFIFDPSQDMIIVLDPDFVTLLLIINETQRTVMFDPSDPTKGGIQRGRQTDLDFDVSDMGPDDQLLVMYEASDKGEEIEVLLRDLLVEQKIVNQYLMEITETEVTQEDVVQQGD